MKMILEKDLDYGRDALVEVVATYDFNGDIIATVFFTGYPVMLVELAADYEPTLLYDSTQPEASQTHAFADFMYQLGEYDEDDYLAYVENDTTETLGNLVQSGDGQEVIALVGEVAQALHREFPEDTPEPVGW